MYTIEETTKIAEEAASILEDLCKDYEQDIAERVVTKHMQGVLIVLRGIVSEFRSREDAAYYYLEDFD